MVPLTVAIADLAISADSQVVPWQNDCFMSALSTAHCRGSWPLPPPASMSAPGLGSPSENGPAFDSQILSTMGLFSPTSLVLYPSFKGPDLPDCVMKMEQWQA